MNEEKNFVDAEQYSGGEEKTSFREIVLQHVKRITVISSKELRGGYNETKVTGNLSHSIYVPDSREEYGNAVNCLADLLLPHFDKKMRIAESRTDKDFEKERSSLVKEFKEKETNYSDTKQRVSVAKLNSRRKLFRALMKFLHRKKYLELGSVEE